MSKLTLVNLQNFQITKGCTNVHKQTAERRIKPNQAIFQRRAVVILDEKKLLHFPCQNLQSVSLMGPSR